MPLGSSAAISPKVAASFRFVSSKRFSVSPGAMYEIVLLPLMLFGPQPPLPPSETRASQRCQPAESVVRPVTTSVDDLRPMICTPSIFSRW